MFTMLNDADVVLNVVSKILNSGIFENKCTKYINEMSIINKSKRPLIYFGCVIFNLLLNFIKF